MGVKLGCVLVAIPKIWNRSVDRDPQIIATTVFEGASAKLRALDATMPTATFVAGDTVYLREDAGDQFILDDRPVAAVDANDVIYHRPKK